MDEKLLEQVLEEVRGFRAEVATRMGGLETRMGGLETRMDGLETEMVEVRDRTDAIETQVRALGTRIGNLEVEVKGIRDEHGLILRRLEERTAITNAMVARLADDVGYLKGQVVSLIERVDDHDLEIEILRKAVGSRTDKKLGTL